MTDSNSSRRAASFDPSVLEQLARDTDVAVIPQVIDMFSIDGNRHLTQIESALESFDDKALSEAVHALSGIAASCGLMQLSQSLNECENSLRGNDKEEGRAHARRALALAPSAFKLLFEYLKTLD